MQKNHKHILNNILIQTF